jgi:hypothetical protein
MVRIRIKAKEKVAECTVERCSGEDGPVTIRIMGESGAERGIAVLQSDEYEVVGFVDEGPDRGYWSK